MVGHGKEMNWEMIGKVYGIGKEIVGTWQGSEKGYEWGSGRKMVRK